MVLRVVAGLLFCAELLSAQEPVLFQDSFRGKLGPGWFFVRENTNAWRVTTRGLQVRIEPGNMWGPQNDGKNVLVRDVPSGVTNLEVSVTVSNQPTAQYEQVDLVWYYDDSNQVKIGLELVDRKLSIVMGREENDRARTIAIIPIDAYHVELRHLVEGNRLRAQFRPAGTERWRDAGECDLPARGKPRIALQCYQGPADAEHWATINDFLVRKPRP